MNVIELRREIRKAASQIAGTSACFAHVGDFTLRVFETRQEAVNAASQIREAGEAEALLVGRSVAMRYFD